MAVGIRIWRNGVPVLLLTDRLTRLRGVVDTGTANGSVSAGSLGAEQIWYQVIDFQAFGTNSKPPSVSISGGLINWTFASGTNPPNRSVRIVYGAV